MRVVTWNGTAESVSAYLSKGRRVFVAGSLRVDQYDDKDRNPRTAVKVMARTIKFLDAPTESRESGGPQGGGAKSQTRPGAPPSERYAQPHSDDIPF